MEIMKLCETAGNVQDSLITFINLANGSDVVCMSRDINIDGYMILFHEKETWQKFVDVFDILGFDFTTGEPDGDSDTWYIDFELSDGISR